jgi:predicted esterase
VDPARVRVTETAIGRREVLREGVALGARVAGAHWLAAGLLAACRSGGANAMPDDTRAAGSRRAATATDGKGRLRARPGAAPSGSPLAPGLHQLGIGGARDALLYVPASLDSSRPAPLVVTLHGAGGYAERWIARRTAMADAAGVLLLTPESREQTWDVVADGFGAEAIGPDVAFIDRTLGWTFERAAVDPKRIAVEGFSDGASYALSIGLMNGDLFNAILSFSPGFLVTGARVGTSRIFVSHGTRDQVLPIEQCSRKIVPALRAEGYTVEYREFDGGHTIPDEIAGAARQWMAF